MSTKSLTKKLSDYVLGQLPNYPNIISHNCVVVCLVSKDDNLYRLSIEIEQIGISAYSDVKASSDDDVAGVIPVLGAVLLDQIHRRITKEALDYLSSMFMKVGTV